jgi:SAM-dependent methyltransferase
MKLPEGTYRSNDPAYLGEQQLEPKESFRRVVELIAEAHGKGPLSLVDAGCASGAFVRYALTSLDVRECVGFDRSSEHLARARRDVPNAEFIQDSLPELEHLRGRTFDVCTCLGTVALFDDLESALSALLSLRKPRGSVIIYDLVNDDPVDVIMRYRRSEEDDQWQPGFNVWSAETYRRTLATIDRDLHATFVDFNLPFGLPRSDDPLRAWTIETEQQPHQIVVGTGQLLNFKIVRIAPG